MTKTICLDEKYSTTRLLCKIVDDELMLDKDGRIKEECKWNINNLELNIKNSKLIGNPDDKFETVLFLPEGEGRKGEGGLRTKGYFKKSYENKPLISIITVVFNGEKYLEETIQSVINQTYDNVEYIIIDGGSTDGTLDIIKKYEDKIDYWVSERDKGIYDAMNKGITLCCGEIIGIINADDFYCDMDIFKKVAKSYTKDRALYYGNMKIIDRFAKEIKEERYTNKNKLYFGMYLNHPATFVNLRNYKELDMFDSNTFRIAADYDFILRNKLKNSKFIYIDDFIAHMRDGGDSLKNIELTKKETEIARKKNLSFFIYQITNFIKFIRKITK